MTRSIDVELYPHQIEAAASLRSGKILQGGVGCGKSRTAIFYYFKYVCGGTLSVNGDGAKTKPMKSPIPLYIITTPKKRDKMEWEDDAAKFGIFTRAEDSFSGLPMVVDSWNNIQKYQDVEKAFFIFDEQRLVGGGAWVKAFLKIAKKNQWVLATATPGDSWSDYIPVFIANGFYRNRTEFNDNHVIYKRFSKFPQVDRYVGTKRLDRHRDNIVVKIDYTTPATKHEHKKVVEYDRELYKFAAKHRWDVFLDEPCKDAGGVARVLRKISNGSDDRFEAVRELVSVTERSIIFYNYNYELERLRTLADLRPLAEWNGHKHEDIPKGDSWIYLVQYTSGAEGWNCIKTNVTIFYSLNYSYKIMTQAKGRIDRLNTPYKDLHYHTIVTDSTIDKAVERALKDKREFNERTFIKW